MSSGSYKRIHLSKNKFGLKFSFCRQVFAPYVIVLRIMDSESLVCRLSEEGRNILKIITDKRTVKRLLGSPRRRREENIGIDIK